MKPTAPLPEDRNGKPISVAEQMGLTTPENKQSPGRWNFYRCSTCATIWVTVDVNDGCTPFKIACMDRPTLVNGKPVRVGDCPGVMASAFYPKPENWPDSAHKTADSEWYYPPRSERLRLKKMNPRLLEYIQQGGLLMRPPTAMHQFPTISEE